MSKSNPDKASEPQNFGVFSTFAELLDAFRSGNEDSRNKAWSAFHNRYGSHLATIARREMRKKEYLRPICDTDILNSTVTGKIARTMDGDTPPVYRSEGEFKKWLATIVYHKIVEKHREIVVPVPDELVDNEQREKSSPLRVKIQGESVLGTNADGRDITLDNLRDRIVKTSVLDDVIYNELQELWSEMNEQLLGELDDFERKIERLRFYEKKKVADIAKEVNSSKRAVERIITKIKRMYKDLEEEFERNLE